MLSMNGFLLTCMASAFVYTYIYIYIYIYIIYIYGLFYVMCWCNKTSTRKSTWICRITSAVRARSTVWPVTCDLWPTIQLSPMIIEQYGRRSGLHVAHSTPLQDPPFVMRRSGQHTGNDRFEGFLIDLIEVIAVELKFQYELYEVADGNYGGLTSSGEWNGMVNELIIGVYFALLSSGAVLLWAGKGATPPPILSWPYTNYVCYRHCNCNGIAREADTIRALDLNDFVNQVSKMRTAKRVCGSWKATQAPIFMLLKPPLVVLPCNEGISVFISIPMGTAKSEFLQIYQGNMVVQYISTLKIYTALPISMGEAEASSCKFLWGNIAGVENICYQTIKLVEFVHFILLKIRCNILKLAVATDVVESQYPPPTLYSKSK